MRILHLLAMDRFSGAENVAVTIMETCREHETIYSSPDGPIRKIVEGRGLNFIPLSAVNYTGVKSIIAQVKPDLIHAHDPRMSCLAALAAPIGIRIVSHLHNNPVWIQSINYNTLAYHLCSWRFEKIVVVSDCIADEFWMGTRLKKKMVTLPNCLNVCNIRKRATEPAPETDMLFVGRLTEQKDPLHFLQIVEQLSASGFDFSAALVGDGELSSQCEQFIATHNLGARVKMLGFSDNPYSFMARTKILVMPSKWEGFGLVAVEALCLGVPVVCSGAGGLSQIIDEKCGAICNSDHDYFCQITQLLADASMRRAKGENALIQAQRFAAIEQYRHQLEMLYSN